MMVFAEKSEDRKSIPHRLMLNLEKGQNKYGKLVESQDRRTSAAKKKDLEFEELIAFERKLGKYLKYFFAISLIAIFATMGYLLWSNHDAKRSVMVPEPTSDLLKNDPIAQPEEEEAAHEDMPADHSQFFSPNPGSSYPMLFPNRFDKDPEHPRFHWKIFFLHKNIREPLSKEDGSGPMDPQKPFFGDDNGQEMNNAFMSHIIFSLRPQESSDSADPFGNNPDDSFESAPLGTEPPEGEKEEASE
ncbi:uncharacterized protein LOC124412965 [Diprion similis]|uniref:uncharacterized protein LOC124412965 n=1 Tax=Diprion similis TaxID=362088 RepID=UPI001EF87AAC|nr:uncharacterized protein LOC124412965 [Diprion similis]